MKNLVALAVVLASAGPVLAVESAKIRVDTRVPLQDGRVATGVEAVGEPDGSKTSSWTTTNEVAGVRDYEDGWHVRYDDGTGLQDWFPVSPGEVPDHDVLVLNDPVVVGGRLKADETWGTNVLRVVRHNVVVPADVTLEIDAEAPVKFTDEARIVVEEGGRLVARGSWFAEIRDDDWVDGDTNLDGTNSVPSGTQDWIAGMDPADYVHVLMLDGAEQVFPTRTYTRGEVYGLLPSLDRYEEGFFFRGWVTNQAETVGVAADQLAEMDQPALYANWEAIYLNVSTGLVEFAAYSEGESREVAVSANDRWVWSCDADWLDVSAGPGDGALTLRAAVNRSEAARSATVVLSRENGGLVREVSVVQAAMEHAAQPVVHTATGGTTFSDYVVQVVVSSDTPGATIYYTSDGAEPTPENGTPLETRQYGGMTVGVVNVYNSLTLKAMAVRTDLLDSAVTSVRLVREATLAEAMDIPDYYVTTDGGARWTVDRRVSSDGVSSVRSGAMTTSATERRYSRLYTSFEGQGTLTFRWKVSCETDWTGHCDWDYLAFLVDGHLVRRIEGQTDWAEVSHRITGTGAHVVQWVYTKNAGFADYLPGEDCGWVDQVSWTPALFAGEDDDARELFADASWLLRVGLVGVAAGDGEMVDAAVADSDGDGYTNEEEALLGTDPNDPESRFLATIAPNANGVMSVSWSPEKTDTRKGGFSLEYHVMGAKELDGEWKDVTDLNDDEREYEGYRFFRIKVEADRK